MFTLRPSGNMDSAQVIRVWRRAVEATHDFLSPQDLAAIAAEVENFLPQVPLTLAVDADDRAIGFMFVHDGHLEALFIDPDYHGQGIGRLLIDAALKDYPNLTTDVNEQSPQALGFYERIGFERTGRSDLDGQGRAYPLVHLRHRGRT